MKGHNLTATLALVGLLTTVACKRDDLIGLLTDFQWGLKEACSQEWIPINECQIADNGFDIAISVAKKESPDKVAMNVKSTLVSIDQALPANSSTKAFLEGALNYIK